MKNERKGFSVKDIIIIILCIIVLIVLVILLKQSRTNQQTEQEQLSQLQETIQQEGTGKVETGNGGYASVSIDEVDQIGRMEISNTGKNAVDLQNCSIWVDGVCIKQITDKMVLGAREQKVIELGQTIEAKEHTVISIKDANGAVIKALTISQNEQEELQFSVPSGFYDNAISLELSSTAGNKIYYTLDGSDPTIESEQYTEPIKIQNRSGSGYVYAQNEMGNYTPSSIEIGTVVKAISVDSQGNSVEERTESYYVGIGNSSDLAGLPVLSISTDGNNLFNYFDGIYVKGRKYDDAIALGQDTTLTGNYYEDWKKPVHIEYFEGSKDKTLELDAEISILKDYSVTAPQKGFCITADTESIYGGSTASEFFDKFGSLYVYTNKRDNSSKAREYAANIMIQDLEVGSAKLNPCVVFINGEYWGVYMMRSPYNQTYFAENYGITDEQVICYQNGYMNNGDYRDAYDKFYNDIIQRDMRIADNYEYAKKVMDMQSYIDYICVNMYLANADHGDDECVAWRTIQTGENEYSDGKWRWIIGKVDNAMGSYTENGITKASIDTFLLSGVREDKMFRTFIQNNEFVEQLQDRMDYLEQNIFTPDKVAETLKQVSAQIGKAATSSYGRFYASTPNNFYSQQMEYIQDFFDNRGQYIVQYTAEIKDLEQRWNSVNTADIVSDTEMTENVTEN